MMTRDEILNMSAGRKLDELIAQYVFGAQKHQWELLPNTENTAYCSLCGTTVNKRVLNTDELVLCLPGSILNYSTNIVAAWEVFEWLSQYSVETAVRNDVVVGHESDGWCVSVWWFKDIQSSHAVEGVYADTAPLAICRAALLALMTDVK
jgi:hypothetical protein